MKVSVKKTVKSNKLGSSNSLDKNDFKHIHTMGNYITKTTAKIP